MLGQEDNPARLREEIERAKHPPGEDGQPRVSAEELEAARQALFDPRSYLAKSVPRRMAIISAGVVMNLIFALVAAVVAFGLGVRQARAASAQFMPGDGAWQADLRVGDEILEVNGRPVVIFDDILRSGDLGRCRERLAAGGAAARREGAAARRSQGEEVRRPPADRHRRRRRRRCRQKRWPLGPARRPPKPSRRFCPATRSSSSTTNRSAIRGHRRLLEQSCRQARAGCRLSGRRRRQSERGSSRN